MYCYKCGHEIPEGSFYCQHCGSHVPQAEECPLQSPVSQDGPTPQQDKPISTHSSAPIEGTGQKKEKGVVIKKLKNWLIVLAILVCGYFMYLTNVSQIFYISGTYGAEDGIFMAVMKFEDGTMSTYLLDPDMDTMAVRIDYQVEYRKYNKDFIGNYWNHGGLAPLTLRGADTAGRVYAECIGCAIWPVEGDMMYFARDEIQEMEKAYDTDYSFTSYFTIKGDSLKLDDYTELVFQKVEDVPMIEAELMRLIDSLCPPEF